MMIDRNRRNKNIDMRERSEAAFKRLCDLSHALKLDPAQRTIGRPKSKTANRMKDIEFKVEW